MPLSRTPTFHALALGLAFAWMLLPAFAQTATAPAAGAVAGGAAAVTTSGNAAPPAGEDVSFEETAGNTSISVDQVLFSALADPISPQQRWMQVRVDFAVNKGPQPGDKWVPGVNLALTLGWGKISSTSATVDVAVSAQESFVALQVNGRYSAYFFVPPETLQSNSRIPYEASLQPTFYVVQFKVGSAEVPFTTRAISSSLKQRIWVEGFLNRAVTVEAKFPGQLMIGIDAPRYIYDPVNIQHPTSMLPTVVRQR